MLSWMERGPLAFSRGESLVQQMRDVSEPPVRDHAIASEAVPVAIGEAVPDDRRDALQDDPGAVEEALESTDLPESPDEVPPALEGHCQDGVESVS